jgi:hypothetical protein
MKNIKTYFNKDSARSRKYAALNRREKRLARRIQLDYMSNIVKRSIDRAAYNRKQYDKAAHKLLDKVETRVKWDTAANKLLNKVEQRVKWDSAANKLLDKLKL